MTTEQKKYNLVEIIRLAQESKVRFIFISPGGSKIRIEAGQFQVQSIESATGWYVMDKINPNAQFTLPEPKPEKKKLYAYLVNGETRVIYDKTKLLSIENKDIFTRAPEYDIDFPLGGE